MLAFGKNGNRDSIFGIKNCLSKIKAIIDVECDSGGLPLSHVNNVIDSETCQSSNENIIKISDIAVWRHFIIIIYVSNIEHR